MKLWDMNILATVNKHRSCLLVKVIAVAPVNKISLMDESEAEFSVVVGQPESAEERSPEVYLCAKNKRFFGHRMRKVRSDAFCKSPHDHNMMKSKFTNSL